MAVVLSTEASEVSVSRFEDTLKNLLRMPPGPHKPAKAEKDGRDKPAHPKAKSSGEPDTRKGET